MALFLLIFDFKEFICLNPHLILFIVSGELFHPNSNTWLESYFYLYNFGSEKIFFFWFEKKKLRLYLKNLICFR